MCYVRPSSKVRKELEPLGVGRSWTGVSEPTSKGFPLVPGDLALTGGSEPISKGFPLVPNELALVTPSPGAEVGGRGTADCGKGDRVGALPLEGVPIGVEVAIGSPLGT